ncbi:hypothetical protein RhiirA4_417693 [Rhizophagus irregularis]|uniref:Uncharacterized protein n=1 Tax=Rhizophagus irregularis TaxID=588596 RepID=A0A2I1G7U4_9GLOM|nr:hypothetical protein RhiirA4_417693 [Rhizophagus irregularis]
MYERNGVPPSVSLTKANAKEEDEAELRKNVKRVVEDIVELLKDRAEVEKEPKAKRARVQEYLKRKIVLKKIVNVETCNAEINESNFTAEITLIKIFVAEAQGILDRINNIEQAVYDLYEDKRRIKNLLKELPTYDTLFKRETEGITNEFCKRCDKDENNNEVVELLREINFDFIRIIEQPSVILKGMNRAWEIVRGVYNANFNDLSNKKEGDQKKDLDKKMRRYSRNRKERRDREKDFKKEEEQMIKKVQKFCSCLVPPLILVTLAKIIFYTLYISRVS